MLAGSAPSDSEMAGGAGTAELPLMACAEACRASAAADSAMAAALSGLAASAAALASSGCTRGPAESELVALAAAWGRCRTALFRACPRSGPALDSGAAALLAPAAAVRDRHGRKAADLQAKDCLNNRQPFRAVMDAIEGPYKAPSSSRCLPETAPV